jgi:plasmid stability protein
LLRDFDIGDILVHMVDLLIRNIRPDTHLALKRLAADRDTTLSDVARQTLEAATGTTRRRFTPELLAELAEFRAAVRLTDGPDAVETIREMRDSR